MIYKNPKEKTKYFIMKSKMMKINLKSKKNKT